MKILVVDDDPGVIRTTAYALRALGHEAFTAENTTEAWRVLKGEPVDAMFLDVNLGAEAGLDLLQDMKAKGLETAVIVFTAGATIANAVEAMRRGAYDYVSKPFGPDEIKLKLRCLERDRHHRARIHNLEEQVAEAAPGTLLDSAEPAVVRAYAVAFRAAASEATILILGPSGTGKTVLARAVHARSPRAAGPFITINCPSLSRALLESELFGHVRGSFTGAITDTNGKVAAARGGTLFFDEIGEAPLEVQSKLLRLLEDRTYERLGETCTHRADVRVICATNRNLLDDVAAGRFREDLYYRIKVVTVAMPPLVDRLDDLRPMVENFLRFFAHSGGRPRRELSREAYAVLGGYAWPGNLRELRNVIERGVILAVGDMITPGDFPEEIQSGRETAIRPGHRVTLEQLEEEHIRRVVGRVDSLNRAATILGIDTATLYRKRQRLQMA